MMGKVMREVKDDWDVPLDLTKEMEIPNGIRPDRGDQPILSSYRRTEYLTKVFGITDVARLPFRIQEPEYYVSNRGDLWFQFLMCYHILCRLEMRLTHERDEVTADLCKLCVIAERAIVDELRNREKEIEDV